MCLFLAENGKMSEWFVKSPPHFLEKKKGPKIEFFLDLSIVISSIRRRFLISVDNSDT